MPPLDYDVRQLRSSGTARRTAIAERPSPESFLTFLMRLYNELASWWPLLSAPADYAEEAAFYRRVLVETCDRPPHSLVGAAATEMPVKSLVDLRFARVADSIQ